MRPASGGNKFAKLKACDREGQLIGQEILEHTGAINEMKANPKIGRAEMLRRSITALIAKGKGWDHPSIWASFVLVATADSEKRPVLSPPILPRDTITAVALRTQGRKCPCGQLKC